MSRAQSEQRTAWPSFSPRYHWLRLVSFLSSASLFRLIQCLAGTTIFFFPAQSPSVGFSQVHTSFCPCGGGPSRALQPFSPPFQNRAPSLGVSSLPPVPSRFAQALRAPVAADFSPTLLQIPTHPSSPPPPPSSIDRRRRPCASWSRIETTLPLHRLILSSLVLVLASNLAGFRKLPPRVEPVAQRPNRCHSPA